MTVQLKKETNQETYMMYSVVIHVLRTILDYVIFRIEPTKKISLKSEDIEYLMTKHP